MRRWIGGTLLAGTALLAAGLGGFLVLDRMYPPDFSRLAVAGTEVLDREGRTLGMVPAPGGIWRLRTTVDDLSPVFLDLLLRTEDRRFYRHHGVDLLALGRATTQWVVAGRVVSGGSTLTMQAARLLEPRRRTLVSKMIEAFRALQLEERLDKRQILGIWLTLAPYGGNLEGVRAGAQAWFGERPAALDQAQAALLVAIPRRPEALRPDRHADRAALLRNRLLGPDAAAFGGEPMPASRIGFPRHAEAALRPVLAAAVAEPVRTTLDLPLQIALERSIVDQLQAVPPRASLSAMVVDAESREVRAVVSGDGSRARGGALDLTRAWRSPGSALKPLLYGLAFQDGLVSPSTPVNDLPRHFGRYAPEDFDRSFAGEVTAAEALQRSLNLPAVSLLDRIGPHRFHAWLMAAGIGLRLPPGAGASLPLALGGVGIQLRDLVRLYAALGTDGQSLPLRWVPGGGDAPTRPLLQPSAAAIVADVLTRPFPGGGLSGIAWKTGTSWGGRDAWAAGFDRRNVVAVWAGRPDGTAIPGATGVRMALPVLHQVFGLLPAAPRPDYQSAPATAATPRTDTAAMTLLFPPPGATLSADGPVPIRVMGGRRPVTFLVDGISVPSAAVSRTALWQPDGPGFYTLAAQDADGSVVKVQVRVR
ncbi:MAG: penicillin-binding protein 1C [Janthinobacterium lividum]